MLPNIELATQMAHDHCAAWTERRPDDVAARYSETTSFAMNWAEPMTSRAEISAMAAGFLNDFPDLVLTCDKVLVAPQHMIYAWTLTGHHKETGNYVEFSGWEEWDLDEDLSVVKSLGWYDGEDYERQVAGTA